MALPYCWTVMNEATRTKKLTTFGSLKYVYPAELMRELRTFFESSVQVHLPGTRILYWT